jgi:hypothetical protein
MFFLFLFLTLAQFMYFIAQFSPLPLPLPHSRITSCGWAMAVLRATWMEAIGNRRVQLYCRRFPSDHGPLAFRTPH